MRTDATLTRLRQIVKEASRAGERLPPERVLATRLGVSRGTLRRALEVLEAEGKIWRHVGRGTFAGARPPVIEAGAAVTRFTNPAEVMEVRRIIEPSMAALAAIRASANDISVMENCLRKGEAATTTSAFEMWDGMLHRTIATAARNTLLLSLFNAVNAVRGEQVWGQLKDASLTRQRKDVYADQHRRLVAAIRQRDDVGAERIMRDHLETVTRDLLGTARREG